MANRGQFICDKCNYKGSSTQKLIIHKKSKHEGIKYLCDQCEYKSRKQGITYDCDNCKYRGKAACISDNGTMERKHAKQLNS